MKTKTNFNSMKYTDLTMSHIVLNNPIINDDYDTREKYLKYLKRYLRLSGCIRLVYSKAAYDAYKELILKDTQVKETHDIQFYKNFILFDFLHIISYEPYRIKKEKLSLLKRQYIKDFFNGQYQGNNFEKIMQKDVGLFSKIIKDSSYNNELEYTKLIRENLTFKQKYPYKIMVTATMSAGKSTFINAITGQHVCLSQNMACTSKVHSIINKAYDDGIVYKYDYICSMNSDTEEVLKNNEKNASDKIIISAPFHGRLEKERVIINDTPGVNYSGDETHKKITDRLIKSKSYDLLIYVMNSTQLATDDEAEHLDFVKKTKGNKRVIFVINKVDAFSLEDENVDSIIAHQVEYLKKKGFKDPVVCPISARAGYVAKQFGNREFSRSEQRELYNYVDKFEQMNLPRYYEKHFPNIKIKDVDEEEKQLIKTCGLAYVEKIISSLIKGGI